jgi:Kef-type K+ transport system membrane component KefB
MIAVSALLAQYINLPGIVGTFLAGLAVNAAVKDKPAKNKLEFVGNTLFIPIFFIVTGFLINPLALLRSLTHDSILAGGIIAALVAATLAATLVAYRTFNAAGQPLLDSRMLNGVLIMVLVTSVLGPVLTQHFALLMSEPEPHRPAPATSSS